MAMVRFSPRRKTSGSARREAKANVADKITRKLVEDNGKARKMTAANERE